jgi:hypothetical protein
MTERSDSLGINSNLYFIYDVGAAFQPRVGSISAVVIAAGLRRAQSSRKPLPLEKCLFWGLGDESSSISERKRAGH